jgi:hypothetical protein
MFVTVSMTWGTVFRLVSGIIASDGYRIVVSAGLTVARRLTYRGGLVLQQTLLMLSGRSWTSRERAEIRANPVFDRR